MSFPRKGYSANKFFAYAVGLQDYFSREEGGPLQISYHDNSIVLTMSGGWYSVWKTCYALSWLYNCYSRLISWVIVEKFKRSITCVRCWRSHTVDYQWNYASPRGLLPVCSQQWWWEGVWLCAPLCAFLHLSYVCIYDILMFLIHARDIWDDRPLQKNVYILFNL